MSSHLSSTTVGTRAAGRQLRLDLTATESPLTDGLLAADNSIAARLSHELITPLTVIMGALETFQKHDHIVPDDKRKRLLEIAIESGRELNSLIHSLVQRVSVATPAARGPDDGSRVIRLPLN